MNTMLASLTSWDLPRSGKRVAPNSNRWQRVPLATDLPEPHGTTFGALPRKSQPRKIGSVN